MEGIHTNCSLTGSKQNNLLTENQIISHPDHLFALKEELNFFALADRWIDVKSAEVRPSTLKKYRTTLRKYLVPVFGKRLLKEITSQDLELLQKDLILSQNLSPVTAGQILLVFKMVYRFGYSSRNLEAPALSVRPLRRHSPSIRVLSRFEQKKLSSYLLDRPDHTSVSIYLAMTTGLRIGEICALRWQDIDLEDEVIMVRHPLQRVETASGHSGAKTELQLVEPKTSSSHRIVPLTPNALRLCRLMKQEDPVFLASGQTRPLDPRTLQNRFYRILEECSIHNAHFHTLRHTFATRCVEESIDIKCLSELLGHSSVQITLEKYVHISLEVKKSSIRKAAGALE